MSKEGINGFWKEIKKTKRNPSSEWILIKDDKGKQYLDPELQEKKYNHKKRNRGKREFCCKVNQKREEKC